MMMSSNGNIFRVTGPLWGESTGVMCARTNDWANIPYAGDLRLYGTHCDVTVILKLTVANGAV